MKLIQAFLSSGFCLEHICTQYIYQQTRWLPQSTDSSPRLDMLYLAREENVNWKIGEKYTFWDIFFNSNYPTGIFWQNFDRVHFIPSRYLKLNLFEFAEYTFLPCLGPVRKMTEQKNSNKQTNEQKDKQKTSKQTRSSQNNRHNRKR